MKLKRVHIKNFKGIKDVEIDFMGPSGPRWMTALLGDNGSGKTTVLQAIALVLTLATKVRKGIGDFSWPGFLADRLGTLGPVSVSLLLEFHDDEIQAAISAANVCDKFEWMDRFPFLISPNSRIAKPEGNNEIAIDFDADSLTVSGGEGNRSLLLGREMARAAIRSGTISGEEFSVLGDVFWFDQLRSIGSVVMSGTEEVTGLGHGRSWYAGVAGLREYLTKWWIIHTSDDKPGKKDLIKELETVMQGLMPGIRFVGLEPRGWTGSTTPSPSDFYVLLEQDGRRFDIAEMSSGEQAIFPLIFEFVRLDIPKSKSIVLIDELELHLHPPEQQALFRALPIIGPDCQYIITTHSEVLTDVIPNEWEVRLDKGQVI